MKTKKLASLLSRLFLGLTFLTVIWIACIIVLFATKNFWLTAVKPLSQTFLTNNALIKNSVDLTPIFSSLVIYVLYIIQVSLYGLLFYLLSQLFKSAIHEKIFTKKNLRKLYMIGSSVMGITTLSNLLGFYAYSLINLEPTKFTSVFSDIVFGLAPGILILTIGLFFSQGIRLQKENELTI